MSRHFEDKTEERTQAFTNLLIFRIHLLFEDASQNFSCLAFSHS